MQVLEDPKPGLGHPEVECRVCSEQNLESNSFLIWSSTKAQMLNSVLWLLVLNICNSCKRPGEGNVALWLTVPAMSQPTPPT